MYVTINILLIYVGLYTLIYVLMNKEEFNEHRLKKSEFSV